MRDKLHRINNKRSYGYAIDDANKIVRKALKKYPGHVAVGVSGGKDSVAMAHLVAQHCNPLVIWNDSGLELPESESVVKELCSKLSMKLVIAKDFDAMDRKAEIGNQESLKRTDETDRLCIIEPVRQAIKTNNITLEFVGLREEESRSRRMLIRRNNGILNNNKRWGCATAWPMRKWLPADVFAYIDEHGLPLHTAYTREEWQERNTIRVSWLWDSNRENKGDLVYLRKYYPEIYRSLRSRGCIDAF